MFWKLFKNLDFGFKLKFEIDYYYSGYSLSVCLCSDNLLRRPRNSFFRDPQEGILAINVLTLALLLQGDKKKVVNFFQIRIRRYKKI